MAAKRSSIDASSSPPCFKLSIKLLACFNKLVDKGYVTLQGHVHSEEDKHTASKAVENVGGLVKGTTNLLTVTHD